MQRSELRFQHKPARDHYIPAERQGPEPMRRGYSRSLAWGHGGSCEFKPGLLGVAHTIGGLLRLGSSFSRIGAQSLRGHLYNMVLIGLGREICDQTESIGFSVLGI